MLLMFWYCGRTCPKCSASCTFINGHGGSHNCSNGHSW